MALISRAGRMSRLLSETSIISEAKRCIQTIVSSLHKISNIFCSWYRKLLGEDFRSPSQMHLIRIAMIQAGASLLVRQ